MSKKEEWKCVELEESVKLLSKRRCKEVKIKDEKNGEEFKVLLVRNGRGELKAVANKCPHYQAPLVTGVVGEDHIRCSWHGACFNLTTGDIEDYPCLDGLQTYQLRENAERIELRVSKESLKNYRKPFA